MGGRFRRILSWMLAAALVVGLLPVAIAAEETVASWSIDTATSSQTKGGVFATELTDISGDNGTNSYAASNRFGGASWSEGKAFYFTTPTTGYSALTIEGKVRASKTGPASVQLQGKVGETWTNLGDSISIGNSSSTTTKNFSVALSTTDMDNQTSAQFRLVVDTSLAGNGSSIASTGTMYIDGGITISGTSDGDTPVTTQCATPTSTPASGSTVVQGTTVTITCSTEGATLKISTDGGTTWTDSDGTITLSEAGTYTAQVKAIKEGLEDSDVLSLSYTVKAVTETTIAVARGGTANEYYQVTGVVTMIDGKNVYIQDATAGIDLYFNAAPSGLALGDKITATGYLTTYNGLVELSNVSTFTTVNTGNDLPSITKTIAEINTDYENNGKQLQAQRVYIENAVIGAINTSGNTTLTQGEDSLNIYKIPDLSSNDLAIQEGDTVNVYGVIGDYNALQLRVAQASDVTWVSTPASTEPEEPAETASLPTDGDYVVWVASSYNQALSSNMNSSGYLLGQAVTVNENGTLSGPTRTEVWTLKRTDGTDSATSAVYTLTQGTLSLGVNASGYLTAAETVANNSWTIEAVGEYLYMKSNENNMYLEWYAKYSDWSLYGTSQPTSDLYQLTFTPVSQVLLPEESLYETDEEVEQSIAAWGGSLNAELVAAASEVSGDLYKSGDMLDGGAKYSAVVSGEQVKPGTSSTSTTTGSTSYYMGATGLGSGTDDYMQFTASTVGWADMTLSFRVRSSNTGPGSLTLQYSADGDHFRDFSTGSYSYAYTSYSNGEQVEMKGSDNITDGVARPSLAPTYYVTFTFDVPAGAENAQTLYIRLVPGTDAAKTSSTLSKTGVVRIDSVILSGYPIVGDGFTSYVTVSPDNEEDQASGTQLTLECATEGAAISYRFVNPDTGEAVKDWTTYDAADKPALPEPLPTVLEAKATAAEKADSITRVWVYAAGTVANVKMSPNGGGVYIPEGENSAQVTLSCDTADAVIYYSLTGDAPEDYQIYNGPITLNKGFGTQVIRAYATKDGFADSAVTTRTFTERASAEYSLFFGQLHSHTSYSDGAGTCAQAFDHAKGLDDAWNIDFLAVTDHSNSFDNADSASLADGSMSEEWVEGHELAENATDDAFTGIYGFEMTWSNGLGHINTFNTPGFQSRTQTRYTTYNTALQNYYEDLKTQSNSISQFNHPGTTFGDFSDFANYDEEIDNLITLIEVGNGEGAIGSSGYFPSYEYYTRALDKGWHVAPTNNQDNHKGNWGDSNTGRSVVLADDLSQESIYDAMRNYRVYATEDLNLEIRYTLDGSVMGSILDGASGDTAHIQVALKDEDDADTAKVQVIVNGGLVAAEKSATCNETVEFDVPTTYAYYYIKVVQADGDIAVTAPVWLGEVEAVGVSSLTAASDLTVAGQEQTITLELYNNENKNLEVTSIVFTDKATGEVLRADDTITSVKKLSTASCSFTYAFPQDGVVTITATVKGVLGGMEKTYTQDLELTVMPVDMVRTVIVDGTHYNDYVTGYYGGNMGNMTTIAADVGVQVKIIPAGDTITAETLENCALLVISAPARKNGTANAGAYTASQFDDAFIQVVKNYVAAGGRVVVCGLADYQDKSAVNGPEGHAAAQINKLLEAIGSSMTVNDDEAYDEVNNGGQAYRLYPENFNMDSPWTKGIVTKDSVAEGETYQTYSQYSGCTVNPGNGTWLVKGFDTTYSIDSDADLIGGIAEGSGPVYFLASETVGTGTVFAAGGVFLSDFEVKAELDNIWDLPYANRTIYENILEAVREDVEPTPIADIRKAELNRVFVAEGYVTNGTENENTTFFDAIYIQDETGGITVFPYSVSGLAIGTKVQIIGYTDAYQGDKELQISSLRVLDEDPHVYEPKSLTTEDAADYDTYGGQLVVTQGEVSDIVKDGGVVSQFKLTDDSGVAATVFIDGYITNSEGENTIGSWIEDGATVSAVGLSYLHPEGDSDVSVPVLRVRDCDEVKLISAASDEPTPDEPAQPDDPTPDEPSSPDEPTPDDSDPVTKPSSQTGKKESAAEEEEESSVASDITDPATGAVTETTERPDGAVVEQVTEKDGTVTTTVTEPDGKKVETVTTPEGDLTITVTNSEGEEAVKIQIPAEIPAVESFVDVPEDHWAAESIEMAAALGLVKGKSEEERVFDMEGSMTRGSLATVLFRLSNGKEGLGNAFKDVGEGLWYTDAVGWAATYGVITGYSAESFGPEDNITREQLAVMLCRYAKLIGLNAESNVLALDAFQDGNQAGDWAKDGLAWCVENGIMQGKGGDVLDPLADITRVEAVTMLQRFIKLL